MVRAAGVAGAGRSLVLAVSDALRGEVYASAIRWEPGRIRTELAPGVWRPEALAELRLAPDALVGEAPPAAVIALERWTGCEMIRPPEGAPRASRLIGLVAVEGGARQVEDVPGWEPVYGRPAEAQARWEIAHGRPLPDSVGGAR